MTARKRGNPLGERVSRDAPGRIRTCDFCLRRTAAGTRCGTRKAHCRARYQLIGGGRGAARVGPIRPNSERFGHQCPNEFRSGRGSSESAGAPQAGSAHGRRWSRTPREDPAAGAPCDFSRAGRDERRRVRRARIRSGRRRERQWRSHAAGSPSPFLGCGRAGRRFVECPPPPKPACVNPPDSCGEAAQVGLTGAEPSWPVAALGRPQGLEPQSQLGDLSAQLGDCRRSSTSSARLRSAKASRSARDSASVLGGWASSPGVTGGLAVRPGLSRPAAPHGRMPTPRAHRERHRLQVSCASGSRRRWRRRGASVGRRRVAQDLERKLVGR